MNEEIHWIPNDGKTTKNEWENEHHTAYIKN